MASAIDPTEPADDVVSAKADQRANWAAAKSEIETLQTDVAGKAATAHNHDAGDITSGELVAARYVDMVGDSGSGGTKGAVPAPGTGDAAAGKFLDAAGAWTVPPPGAFTDTAVIVENAGDATKQVKISAAGVSTSNIRTITMADQDISLVPGTTFQSVDAGLTDIAGLAVTDSNFIVGDGANWVAESGATVRASLGLGTFAVESLNAVPAQTLAGAITGADQTVSRINLLDYGEVTNALSGTGNKTIDLTSGNSVTHTIFGAVTWTFSNPTAADELCGITLSGISLGIGAQTWPVNVKWAGGTAPTFTHNTATFTTDFATDDKLDITAHGFVDGERVHVTTSAADLPAGLSINTNYFVINKTANDFELSTTLGGSAVDITDDGSGTHTLNSGEDKLVFETDNEGATWTGALAIADAQVP